MASKVKNKNLASAQSELLKLVQVIVDVQNLYFKPAKLLEEIRSSTRAIDNLNRTIQRLQKRIEIEKRLADGE